MHAYFLVLSFILYLFHIIGIVALILWVLKMNLSETVSLATGQKETELKSRDLRLQTSGAFCATRASFHARLTTFPFGFGI